MATKFLGTEKCKDDRAVNIFYANSIAQSSCLSFILKTYADLIDKNLVIPNFYWDKLYSHQVIYVELNNTLVSALVFDEQSDIRTSIIVTAGTKSEFENLGLNKICYNYYLRYIKSKGIKRSIGYVSINNSKVIVNKETKKSYIGGRDDRLIVYSSKL